MMFNGSLPVLLIMYIIACITTQSAEYEERGSIRVCGLILAKKLSQICHRAIPVEMEDDQKSGRKVFATECCKKRCSITRLKQFCKM